MIRMCDPVHPGEVIADTVLRKRGGGGLTLSEFARHLRVSRVSLSRIVNGRAAVSAELAIRLAAALGGSAESWLTMQLAYDLARAEKKRRPHIDRIPEVVGDTFGCHLISTARSLRLAQMTGATRTTARRDR